MIKLYVGFGYPAYTTTIKGQNMLLSVLIIILVILLLSGALLYPYISCAVLRDKMVRRLGEEASRAGFKLRVLYRHVFFVRNLSEEYDLLIYNDEILYAVKLWASYKRSTSLVLTRGGRVVERRTVGSVLDVSGSDNSHTVESAPLSVPRTKLSKKYSRGREVRRILLVYPSYQKMLRIEGRREIPIRSGDELFDKRVYSPSAFIEVLREDVTSE